MEWDGVLPIYLDNPTRAQLGSKIWNFSESFINEINMIRPEKLYYVSSSMVCRIVMLKYRYVGIAMERRNDVRRANVIAVMFGIAVDYD